MVMLTLAEKIVADNFVASGYQRLTKKMFHRWIKSQRGNVVCVKSEYMRMITPSTNKVIFELCVKGKWITQELEYNLFWIQTRCRRDVFFIKEDNQK